MHEETLSPDVRPAGQEATKSSSQGISGGPQGGIPVLIARRGSPGASDSEEDHDRAEGRDSCVSSVSPVGTSVLQAAQERLCGARSYGLADFECWTDAWPRDE